MSENSMPLILAFMWAIFLALCYFSFFRTDSKKKLPKKQQRKQASLSYSTPPFIAILLVLGFALIVRVAIALFSKPILDPTSSIATWWYSLTMKNSASPSALLFTFPTILADLASAFFLYKLAERHLALPKTHVLTIVTFWALNPYSLFAASYVQTTSLCFALLFAALYLLECDFPFASAVSGVCVGLSILLNAHTVFFVILLLVYLLFVTKEQKNYLVNIALFVLSGLLFYGVGSVLLRDKLIFEIAPLLSKTSDSILNTPTVNAFNFYTLMDSWKESWYVDSGSIHMDSRIFFLSVRSFGYLFAALSVLATGCMYFFSGKKNHIFFYCGLLSLSFYVFVTGMTPLMILPIALFFYADYVVSSSTNSLLIGFLTSTVGLINLSYINLKKMQLATPLVNGRESVALISALLVLITLIFAYACAFREHGRKKETEDTPFVFQPLSLGQTKKMLKLDWIILAIFTVVALFSNFWELGDMSAPSSAWKATENPETIVEVSGKPSRMTYFLGLGATGQALQVELAVQTSDDGVNWSTIQTVSTSGYCYTWYDISLANTGRYLKFIENADYMQVLEIGLYDNNKNLLPVTVVSGPTGAFDEQDLAEYGKTYKNSMYFDEVYHGRTAYEVTEHINEYEWTHPPLGKLIMSLGIRIFGMNPFGWRAAGALFGALLVPLMYLFGKKIFARTLPAAGMAFLMLFDTFRFAQTRIGTIDTYGVFFIILMYYFMYDFFTMDFKALKSPWQMWRPLLFSGIFMGIGCAAKWIGFYAAIGLAILFFMAFYRFSKENKKMFRQYSAKTIGLCIIFFGVIPFIIYFASYLPHLSLFDYKFSEFIHQQESMMNYHSRLKSTHPYSSSWYMWPFMIRPVYMCSGGSGLEPGFTSRIVGIGNPAIWWMLIPALVYFIYLACKKMKDHRFTFLIVGFLAQYLSWVLIARTTYQYHFFASLPFLFAILLYVLFWLKDNYRITPVLWVYALIVIVAFVAIFPAVSGLPISNQSDWFQSIKAFDTWNFF